MMTNTKELSMPAVQASPITLTIEALPKRVLRALEAVKHAACKDVMQDNLSGIAVYWAGGALRFEATDGHRLARVEIESASVEGLPPPGAPIRRLDAKQAIASLKAQVASNVLKTTLTTLTLPVSGWSWPDTDKIIPPNTGKPGVTGFNPNYMVDALEGAARINKKGCKVTPRGELQPWTVEAKDEDTGDTYLGLVMPMRL